MSAYEHLLYQLRAELDAGLVPESTEHLAKRLELISDGMRLKIPVLSAGVRLFRVRRVDKMPVNTAEVGAPPARVVPIGRVNDLGKSVLYLADSPNTAFAEARATTGRYCLSEWRVQEPKVALANGGIPENLLCARFPNDFGQSATVLGGVEDEELLALFHALFTLQVDQDAGLYRWSIACGLANGFAPICGRTATEAVNGNTEFTGQYPFSGIAYPSVRKDKKSINFAFNDLGQTYVRLDHVQWVELHKDGFFSSIDFGSSWDENGNIAWQARPARYQLQQGESARIIKVGKTEWKYEPNDDLPYFA